MSTLYFGGIDRTSFVQSLGQEKASGMMCQMVYTPSLMEACNNIVLPSGKMYALPLVMDSGAFIKLLNRQDVERYAALITTLGDRCIWYANTDRIGNQEKSNDNYTYLLSLLPKLLHSRILWIYQHGSDLRYLHEGLERHQRIGIGGLVPLFKLNDKTIARQAVTSLAREISRYNCAPHYFGLGIPGIIADLHNYHEDFSVDNTTWLAGAKYGELINNNGQRRLANAGGYDFSKEAILSQNIRTMRKWVECPVNKTCFTQYVQCSLF